MADIELMIEAERSPIARLITRNGGTGIDWAASSEVVWKVEEKNDGADEDGPREERGGLAWSEAVGLFGREGSQERETFQLGGLGDTHWSTTRLSYEYTRKTETGPHFLHDSSGQVRYTVCMHVPVPLLTTPLLRDAISGRVPPSELVPHDAGPHPSPFATINNSHPSTPTSHAQVNQPSPVLSRHSHNSVKRAVIFQLHGQNHPRNRLRSLQFFCLTVR